VHDVAAVMARYTPAWPPTIELLTHLLPQLQTDHRGLNKVLALLRDEQFRLGRTVADPALIRWLTGFSGGSAAAKTAWLLLG
jgi:hypothetical protein